MSKMSIFLSIVVSSMLLQASFAHIPSKTGTGLLHLQDVAFDSIDKLNSQNPVSSCVTENCSRTMKYLGCTGNKKFYHDATIELNWFEAWEYCRSLDLHLAAIENRHEQAFIELFLPRLEPGSRMHYWLSGTAFERPGFIWMANGRALTYTNFQERQPDNANGTEHCIEIRSEPGIEPPHQWNDRNCFKLAYALCQKDLQFS